MKIAARGRGHSIEGQCLCPDGLVIDMRTLNKVIRTTETEIEVEGGARLLA
jgi:FAD/FMN-containing dehydrogenase